MTSQNASHDDFDRLMRQWMDADARVREPDNLLETVVERTRRARRIPGWLLPERWIPMQLTMRLQPVPRLVPVLLLIITLALVGAALVIGIGSWKPLPAPFGPARNGLLAYDANDVIFVSNADGTDARPIVTSVPHAATAAFSPDGTRVAFWGDGSPDSLYVANADGTGVRNVSGDLWIGTDRPPAWSPNSRSIAFSSETGPNRKDEQIYVVDVTSQAARPVAITQPHTLRAFLPAWSPDGTWIAFVGVTSQTSGGKIWIVSPDGSESRVLPTTAAIENTQPQWAPSVAPLRLTYAQAAAIDEQQDIFVLDLSTGVETAISSDPANERWPTWSPDGTRLAWLVGDAPPQLRIAQPDNPASSVTLASDFMGTPPAWSPDGTEVYAADEARSTVIVVTVDKSAPNARFTHDAGFGLPAWQRLAP
jgi:Tol biopolymer transport system component